jgi:hypothetical protein
MDALDLPLVFVFGTADDRLRARPGTPPESVTDPVVTPGAAQGLHRSGSAS